MSEYSKVFGNGGSSPPSLERRVSVLENEIAELKESCAHHAARFDKLDELLPYLIGRIDQAVEGQRLIVKQVTDGFAAMSAQLKTMGDHVLENHEHWRKSAAAIQDWAVEAKIQRRDIDHIKARFSDARELNETTNKWTRDQLMSLTEEHREIQKMPRNLALDITKGIVVAFFATLITYLFNR